jgi:4-hydroxybenzoate polyprenyltransferase
MNISKEKFKLILGGIIVLAAASLMLQPLISYVAGLGRMITFIVTALLIAYLITTVIVRLKGKNCSKRGDKTCATGDADQPTDQGDLKV